MKLYIYHTPESTPTDIMPDCGVAIDVLRATTTIATALAAGAEAVQTFSKMEELLRVSENWDPKLRLRAGERGGAKVEGCDLGNSPLDCTPELIKGKRLFISTTNGTRCLERIAKAPIVLAGAQINRQAVADYILAKQPETVWLVGSGWEGSYSLEDTVCAGAIAASLIPSYQYGNDETIAALALYQEWKQDLLSLFHQASHGQRLLKLNCHKDLEYCAQSDILPVVPLQTEPGLLKTAPSL